MRAYNLSILTPEGKVYDDEVQSVVAPGRLGSFGVLYQHAHMIAAVKLGVLQVDTGNGLRYFVLGDGILEVTDNGVGILADDAQPADSLDDAKKRVTAIEEQLKRMTHPETTHANAT